MDRNTKKNFIKFVLKNERNVPHRGGRGRGHFRSRIYRRGYVPNNILPMTTPRVFEMQSNMPLFSPQIPPNMMYLPAHQMYPGTYLNNMFPPLPYPQPQAYPQQYCSEVLVPQNYPFWQTLPLQLFQQQQYAANPQQPQPYLPPEPQQNPPPELQQTPLPQPQQPPLPQPLPTTSTTDMVHSSLTPLIRDVDLSLEDTEVSVN